MKFLRAEEGDEPSPSTIRPYMQIVSAPAPAPKNGHKRSPAHATQTQVAPSPTPDAPTAPADPTPAPVPAVLPPPALPVPAPIPAPASAPAKPAPVAPEPAHTAPAHAITIRAPKANGSKRNGSGANGSKANGSKSNGSRTRGGRPKHQAREVTIVQPSPPRIRPEMLDACVVALRRMGGPSLQCLGVTSSVRGEGRSTVAGAMAVIHAAEYRRRTILVEFDGPKSTAAEEFGLSSGPGVAEFIRDNLDIEDCIQWVTDDLGVVVAGADPSMATLLRGSTAEDIVTALSDHADTLVLDLPPLEKGAGGVQLVDLCEAVALVVRAGVSTHQIQEAAAVLTTPPFVILNGVKSAAPRWVRRLLGMR